MSSWERTITATGNVSAAAGPPLAGAPVVGEAEIGPWVFSMGATFKF